MILRDHEEYFPDVRKACYNGANPSGSWTVGRRDTPVGHPGAGLKRDPDPDERESADPPAKCSRCGTGLTGARPKEPGWAQVWDVRFSRSVTEWLLPALVCPCCGKVTMADAPAGAYLGSVSCGPGANTAALLLMALLACHRSAPDGLRP